jgi:hypothetical protein
MGDSALMEPAIQVRVRSGPGQSDAARAKMQEIIDVLHGVLSQTIGSTHYLRIKAQTSEPAFIGFDVRGRPEFTMSFRALRAVMVST